MWQDRRKRFAATCIKSSYLPVRNFVNRPQMVYQISHSFHLFATDVTGLWDLSVYAVFFFEMSVGIFLRCESCPTDQTRARPIRHYCYHIWNIQQGDKNCQKIMYFVSKCLSNSKLFYTSLYPCGDFGASPKKSYPTAIPHIWNIRISWTDRYLCESSAIAHEIFQVFQGIGRARIRTIRLQHCHSFITVIRLLLDPNHFWKIESGRENFRDWKGNVLLLTWWIACLKCKMGQCNS